MAVPAPRFAIHDPRLTVQNLHLTDHDPHLGDIAYIRTVNLGSVVARRGAAGKIVGLKIKLFQTLPEIINLRSSPRRPADDRHKIYEH